MTQLTIIIAYLALLLGLGYMSSRLFRGTTTDFFVASRSLGSFLLLASIFGTTMTAFALVGSTGQAYSIGVVTYAKIASISALLHSACFFYVGTRLWAFGKHYGYLTQIQFFRARFDSDAVGYLLFPILIGLIIPYLLIGLLGAGSLVEAVTRGAFPTFYAGTNGAVPAYITSAVISIVVILYVCMGGVRSTAWANAFQTIIFMVVGLAAFVIIADKLGGPAHASSMVPKDKLIRTGNISNSVFLAYTLIPLSVGMFPHLFQNFLTAKSAEKFKLTMVAHPICIMLTWVPCILIGIWATGAIVDGVQLIPDGTQANAVLGMMVAKLTNPVFAGIVSVGVLAAIMSSLDSQFMCMGTMFTQDILVHTFGKDRFTEKQILLFARIFIIAIVLITFLLSLSNPVEVFPLAIWCFTGFASLFPIAVASIYWKRTSAIAVMVSTVATAATWLYLFFDSDFGKNKGYLFYDLMPVVVTFGTCALTLIVISFLTPAPHKDVLDKYFKS